MTLLYAGDADWVASKRQKLKTQQFRNSEQESDRWRSSSALGGAERRPTVSFSPLCGDEAGIWFSFHHGGAGVGCVAPSGAPSAADRSGALKSATHPA